MSECKYTNKDGLCLLHSLSHSGPFYKELCHEGPCTDYESLTNADRIRRMTDEELAEFMPSTKFGYKCPPLSGKCPGKCVPCWLGWLKQEEQDQDLKIRAGERTKKLYSEIMSVE